MSEPRQTFTTVRWTARPATSTFASRSCWHDLFLVGISTHFPYRSVRYGLIGLSVALLALSLVQLAELPLPPS
jgi:hypothetical protein